MYFDLWNFPTQRKTEMIGIFSVIFSKITFYKNPSSASRIFTCVEMDGGWTERFDGPSARIQMRLKDVKTDVMVADFDIVG
jgi:hypothetical protein